MFAQQLNNFNAFYEPRQGLQTNFKVLKFEQKVFNSQIVSKDKDL